jgi:hypothetical protein
VQITGLWPAQGQVNTGHVQVNLTPAKTRAFHQNDLMAWARQRYPGDDTASITVNMIDAVGGGAGFRSQPVQFNIRGKDMAELTAWISTTWCCACPTRPRPTSRRSTTWRCARAAGSWSTWPAW